MDKRPNIIYILVLLWLTLSVIFVLLGGYSLSLVLDIPSWNVPHLVPILHFGFFMSTIVWFVFSSLFVIFAYGTYRKDSWAWTTGIIISTIFLVIFGLMLVAFMVNAVQFFDPFSVSGLVTVILLFINDLGVIFFLTRPATKLYFESES